MKMLLAIDFSFEWQFSNYLGISRREQVNFHWKDDEVRFVLDQHT
jgi:hypothetical protein